VTLTNPPFMPQKGVPPFHLRPWTLDELAQAKRLRESYEQLFPQPPVTEPPCES
jgi:hypothetical protein